MTCRLGVGATGYTVDGKAVRALALVNPDGAPPLQLNRVSAQSLSGVTHTFGEYCVFLDSFATRQTRPGVGEVGCYPKPASENRFGPLAWGTSTALAVPPGSTLFFRGCAASFGLWGVAEASRCAGSGSGSGAGSGSGSGSFEPWNPDWDRRHPPSDGKRRAYGRTRHQLLVRHGQYKRDGTLTDLGRLFTQPTKLPQSGVETSTGWSSSRSSCRVQPANRKDGLGSLSGRFC